MYASPSLPFFHRGQNRSTVLMTHSGSLAWSPRWAKLAEVPSGAVSCVGLSQSQYNGEGFKDRPLAFQSILQLAFMQQTTCCIENIPLFCKSACCPQWCQDGREWSRGFSFAVPKKTTFQKPWFKAQLFWQQLGCPQCQHWGYLSWWQPLKST